MIKKIPYRLDGSENAFKTLKQAVHLARICQAELHTISVEEITH